MDEAKNVNESGKVHASADSNGVCVRAVRSVQEDSRVQ